jgi:hypothetical protein
VVSCYVASCVVASCDVASCDVASCYVASCKAHESLKVLAYPHHTVANIFLKLFTVTSKLC